MNKPKCCICGTEIEANGHFCLIKYGPYRHSSDCLNAYEDNQYDSKEYRDGCVRCKLAWLEREYDTYPSEDGKWEAE